MATIGVSHVAACGPVCVGVTRLKRRTRESLASARAMTPVICVVQKSY
jgi:hypothetical protein